MMRATGRLAAVVLGLLLLLGLSGTASATPLGIVLNPSPDLFVGFGSTSYNAASDTLTLEGQPQSYFLESTACDPACTISGGAAALDDFMLVAEIDSSGNLVSGTVTINGTVGSLGYGSPLLTGTLTAFGFDSGTPALPFEFTFTVTGGSAAGDFGSKGAIIWGHNSSFSGSFNSNFSASFVSSGDVGVPEPSAALLLITGALALTTRRKHLG